VDIEDFEGFVGCEGEGCDSFDNFCLFVGEGVGRFLFWEKGFEDIERADELEVAECVCELKIVIKIFYSFFLV